MAIFSFLAAVTVLVATRLPFATCLLNYPASTSQCLGLVAGDMSCCLKYSRSILITKQELPHNGSFAQSNTSDCLRNEHGAIVQQPVGQPWHVGTITNDNRQQLGTNKCQQGGITMAASSADLAPASLSVEGKADLARWIELDRQHKQLTEQLQPCNGPGHEISRQLELLWHEKALLADRLLSVLALQLAE
ncbi:hypothetical protein [Marinobacterium weihaiense]|uniref:Secreted protein n=1 Tax=Marinobacterium weihaiense TaxID=2851016 RepID=A0ABS6MBH4_9GAMM|nr:hypothetical protein [Marinobacterium weihaiense]MBV0933191.1 hypothetical protein [Marinobacterium weihaiense]